jgi:hypothetical protein
MELFPSVLPEFTYLDDDGAEWTSTVVNAVRYVVRTDAVRFAVGDTPNDLMGSDLGVPDVHP